MLKYIARKLIYLFKRRDHIAYAKGLGVKVGSNCRFVDNPIWGAEPYLISIGNHVLISGQVVFLTHDGSTHLFREEGPYKDTFKFGCISVGDNCFLGFRSTILPNVCIGNNCIVATGAVVTKNIPDGEVWGGVPARFICKTEDYAKKCFESKLPYDVNALRKNAKRELCRIFKVE